MFNFKKLLSFGEKKSYGNSFMPLGLNFGNTSEIKNYSEDELMNMMKGRVFDCVDVIGDSVADLERNFYSDMEKQKITKTEYPELDSQMLKAIAIYLKTLGVIYILKEKVGNKKTIRLLEPQNVIEYKSGYYQIDSYTYNNGKASYTFTPEEVVKIQTFTPFSDKGGLSPLKGIATQMAMDLSSIEYNRLFFDNGGRPGVVFTHEGKIEEEVKSKFMRAWKNNHGGVANSGKSTFLDQGTKIHDFSQNQKDMDFVNQRTFTKDEILMAFRVPKPLLGQSDGVGFADKKVPEHYYINYTIKPLVKLIQEAFNTQILEKSFLFFEYPKDKDEILKEYQAGLITLNEYRIAVGRTKYNEGDVLINGNDVTAEEVKKEVSHNDKITDTFNKVFQIKTFGTEEYNQKIWETKMKRTDLYESKMGEIQKKIWNVQEKAINKNLSSTKGIKKIENESDLFNAKQMEILYISMYTSFFTDMMNAEGKIAISEISDEAFAINEVNKWIGENIDRMSNDIDDVTRKEMFSIIEAGNKEGLGADAISANIKKQFTQYKKKKGRVEKIARTEVTRASNKSQDEAYEQSGVVSEKEWFTSLDERVAPECSILHGKRIKIGGTFLKEGETDSLGNKVTYETIKYPPRHVNCRCTLRPIISRKSLQKFKEIAQTKGFLINK